MKRAGNLLPQIAETANLYFAYYKASKGKRLQVAVKEYANNLDKNITQLQTEIRSSNIKTGDYEYFTITDPKVRQICAASFPQRVLHHAIMNVCHPYFEKHLIPCTYATRKDKGIYLALDKARRAMLNYNYVAKLDVRKYFDNINHQILNNQLQHIFKDYNLLQLFEQIIASYQIKDGCGVPIGNLTSQYFANFYLSAADHYAYHQLQIPVYLRYMDDILMFHTDKNQLTDKVNQFAAYVSETLQLQFKPSIINRVEQGISYLGYKIYPHIILLNGRSKNRFKTKFKIYTQTLQKNECTQADYQRHVIPLLSFAKHAYTKKLRTNLLQKYEYCFQ